ncbi:MAG: DUF2269 family protein [Chloroflexota bacterium]
MSLFTILLFLHVLGAIAAFGPGFASMVVGPMVAKEPQHANFYARTQLAANLKLVTPLALSMAVTGVLMIIERGGLSNITGGRRWLELAILLYVIAIVYSFAIQAPAGRRLVALTSSPPAPGSPPDPAIPATARRVRLGGMFLGLLVIVIVFLMVVKPF